MAYGDRGAWERAPIAVAWPAMLAAGPLFTTTVALASMYADLPRPVIVAPHVVAAFAMMQVLALIVGALLAFVPVLLGTVAMRALSCRYGWARTGAAWALAGTAVGVLIATVFDAFGSPPVAFGLIATSMVCAGLCYWRARGGGEGDHAGHAADGSPEGMRAATPS